MCQIWFKLVKWLRRYVKQPLSWRHDDVTVKLSVNLTTPINFSCNQFILCQFLFKSIKLMKSYGPRELCAPFHTPSTSLPHPLPPTTSKSPCKIGLIAQIFGHFERFCSFWSATKTFLFVSRKRRTFRTIDAFLQKLNYSSLFSLQDFRGRYKFVELI